MYAARRAIARRRLAPVARSYIESRPLGSRVVDVASTHRLGSDGNESPLLSANVGRTRLSEGSYCFQALAGSTQDSDDRDEAEFRLPAPAHVRLADRFASQRSLLSSLAQPADALEALQDLEQRVTSKLSKSMLEYTYSLGSSQFVGTAASPNNNMFVDATFAHFPQHHNQFQMVAKANFSTSSSSKNGRNPTSFSTAAKIPTPKSQPAQSSSFDFKAFAESALSATSSATKWILSFIFNLPGNTFYYMTHAEERRQKIADIRKVVKEEIDHYWMGTKLLMADVRTARNLLGRTLTGSTLSRRERKQLLRTVSDLFRLVPFSMFLLIPFMEFALPFALRIFPNMLPSTFQDSLKAEENMKRELKSRIAMAQFFQETLEELAKQQKKIASKRKEKNAKKDTDEEPDKDDENCPATIATKQEDSAASMLEFLDRARHGEMLPTDVIIQYATYFKDDLTLDNMPRMQLINMCKYMSIPPYGADSFLRFQLRHKIRSLKEDDQRILWEGIEALTKMELREACQERGMRSTGMSKEAYRRALQQWLDLSVNMNVPISLLIMSRTFFLQDEILSPSSRSETKSVAGLADAISGLDKEVLNEVILELATSEEKRSDPEVRKIKLEVLAQQNERIREEQAERDAAAKKKESSEKSEKVESSDKSPESSKLEEATIDTSTSSESKASHNQFAASEDSAESSGISDDNEESEKLLSAEEMDAIEQLLTADPVSKERAELAAIKEAMRANGDDKKLEVIEKLEEMVEVADEMKSSISEDPVDKTPDYTDEQASETVAKTEKEASEEADKSTTFSTEESTSSEETDSEELESDDGNESEEEDPVVARLKDRVQSMVDKIEVQLSDAEVLIGDKLHFLDKDMDGILTRDEMAECLHQVMKREITVEEAMEIASEMDGNEDGLFTVQELIKWIETNKLVQFEKEGRDAEMDKIIELNSKPAAANEDELKSSQSEESKSSQSEESKSTSSEEPK